MSEMPKAPQANQNNSEYAKQVEKKAKWSYVMSTFVAGTGLLLGGVVAGGPLNVVDYFKSGTSLGTVGIVNVSALAVGILIIAAALYALPSKAEVQAGQEADKQAKKEGTYKDPKYTEPHFQAATAATFSLLLAGPTLTDYFLRGNLAQPSTAEGVLGMGFAGLAVVLFAVAAGYYFSAQSQAKAEAKDAVVTSTPTASDFSKGPASK